MPVISAVPVAVRRSPARARLDLPAAAAWTLGFAPVAYLALSNGGYDATVRGQVGIAVWWIVLLGAALGLLPRRIPVAGWAAFGLLAAFAVWTGAGTTWSESAERTAGELGKVATYAGILALALCAQARAGARHSLNGVAAAIALIGVLALGSRLHPTWFPTNDQAEFLGNSRRLAYPLNYWNALGALMALGVPVLLAVAGGARRIVTQAAAAAVVPVLVCVLFLTISRGAVLALAAGVAVFLLLAPDRLTRLASVAAAAAGSAILVAYADARPILGEGLTTPAAVDAGDRMLLLVAVACLGTGLLQAAIGLVARHAGRPRWLELPRRTGSLVVAACVAGALGVAAVAGAPAQLERSWEEFRTPAGAVAPSAGGDRDVFDRLRSATGNNRYQFWQAAADAQATDPWRGIGPGTFEYWWARNAGAQSIGFVRDAHSLWMETLGETGIVGLALLGGLFLLVLGTGAVRLARAAPDLRLVLAGATAAVTVFCFSAAFEWIWELGAIAVAVLVLGAVALTGRDDRDVRADEGRRDRRSRGLRGRVVLALAALAAVPAVALPLAGAEALRTSRAAAAEGRIDEALRAARDGQRAQPFAATPLLQEALVLESAGDLRSALAAAAGATAEEPTNWRTWIVRARIEVRLGSADAALRSFRTARRLNPAGNLFR